MEIFFKNFPGLLFGLSPWEHPGQIFQGEDLPNEAAQWWRLAWNSADMLAYADDVVQGGLTPHLLQKMVLLGAERPNDEHVTKYFEKYGGAGIKESILKRSRVGRR